MANIEVRAKRLGQTPDGKWKRPGDVFEIDESIASRHWMERTDGKPIPPRHQMPKGANPAYDRATGPDTQTFTRAQFEAEKRQAVAGWHKERDGLLDRIAELEAENQNLKADKAIAPDGEADSKQDPEPEKPAEEKAEPEKPAAKTAKATKAAKTVE